ncbi:PINc/VapC family ATPase [Nanoarchaeota archaeon]
METIEKLCPDTSVVIEGIISQKLENKQIKFNQLLIHEAILSELEHQANENKEIGYLGIEEVKRLRDLSTKHNFEIHFSGKKPHASEIKFASLGEIDSLIRELAYAEDATLITADKIQAKLAEAKGMKVILEQIFAEKKDLKLSKFFDPTTMSVHLRENLNAFGKKGIPGEWKFEQIGTNKLTRDGIIDIAREITEECKIRKDGFIEIERPGSTIVQLSDFRIVITKPPFADGWEITAVRPVKRLELDEYNISDKLKQRISEQAEGILIAGAPGHGKSTFATALAKFYANTGKVVKTVEAPRDLDLPDTVTQYSISHGSSQEIHDILLLSRPDYTIFDEMRNTEDFKLFADLRLSGVGMVGIVHATNPIDAIQRFIGRIELGVIPQVIDTVVFIKNGQPEKVFGVKMDVKVPSGMIEADLARPVVTVTDFETGKLEFEMYSYGEETVVIPVKAHKSSPLQSLAIAPIEKEFRKYSDNVQAEFVSDNKCIVYVNEKDIAKIIGKQGKNIEALEKKLGLSLDIRELGSQEIISEESSPKTEMFDYDVVVDKKSVKFLLTPDFANKDVDIHIEDNYLLTGRVSKKGIVKIKKDQKIARNLLKAINEGRSIRVFG